MATDWLLRVGNGENFIRSYIYNIWGINGSTSPSGKYFIKNAREGDRLWFIKSKSNGLILAQAILVCCKKRDIGPLINVSLTNEEIGWTNKEDNWNDCDYEIHYKNLYNLSELNLLTFIKCMNTISKYNDKCSINLPLEYENICKYIKIKNKF